MYYRVVMRKKLNNVVEEKILIPSVKSDALSMLKLASSLVDKYGKIEVAIFRRRGLDGEWNWLQSTSHGRYGY